MGDEDVAKHPVSRRVLLIRHGETVDNIKGLYAGVRDSALTSHGVQQSLRLGQHLKKQNVKITHLFSSNLSRAVKTGDILRAAQDSPKSIDHVQLECLREQDFGFYEGKPFYLRTASSKSGKDEHREEHKDDLGFQDIESKESMKQRAQTFVQQYLTPVLDGAAQQTTCTIAVVSHGMLLSALWKVLLNRQPPSSVTLGPEVRAPEGSLEHLGGWSNTGYLDLKYSLADVSVHPSNVLDAAVPSAWSLRVSGVNSRDHLTGLKRTRGGVGSAQHDDSQRSIDTFFKKPRVE